MGGNAMFLLNIFWKTLDILLKYGKSSIKPPKGLFLSIRFGGEGAG